MAFAGYSKPDLKAPSHLAGLDDGVSRSNISFTSGGSGIKELKISTNNKCLAVCRRGQYGGNKEQHGGNTTVP